MRLITVLLIGFIAAPAFAQVATPPAQPSDINAPAPLFRVTVVGRTTAAINYRPRSGNTKVDLAGTALLPEARGYAQVSGEKGYIEIDAHFKQDAAGHAFRIASTSPMCYGRSRRKAAPRISARSKSMMTTRAFK